MELSENWPNWSCQIFKRKGQIEVAVNFIRHEPPDARSEMPTISQVTLPASYVVINAI